jgi:hypothetical protein
VAVGVPVALAMMAMMAMLVVSRKSATEALSTLDP